MANNIYTAVFSVLKGERIPSSPHTGTIANTLIYNKKICDANSGLIQVGDVVWFKIRFGRNSGLNNSVTIFAELRNVAGIGTTVGRAAIITSQGGATLEKTLPVYSNTQLSNQFPTNINAAQDSSAWSSAYTLNTITIPDITGALWFWVSLTNASALDEVQIDYIELIIKRHSNGV